MFKRVENIAEKLKDPAANSLLRIDVNSWSEAEKALFQKGDEVIEEYRRTGNIDVLEKNGDIDIIYKNIEVVWKRITDLYCYTVPKAINGITGLNHEIVNYLFKLHFLNFEIDVLSCSEPTKLGREGSTRISLRSKEKWTNDFPHTPRL